MLLALLLLAPLGAGISSVAADAHWDGEDQGLSADLQAQDILVYFDNLAENTIIQWRNVATTQAFEMQDLQSAEYLLYRHDGPINSSVVENLSLNPIATIAACPSADVFDCPNYGHSYTYALPPSVNGSFYYAIATKCTVCSQGNWSNTSLIQHFETGASNIFDPVPEQTHAITAPFLMSGSYDVSRGITTLTWINLNTILPGSLATNSHQIKIYKHEEAANRLLWPVMQKELIGLMPEGNTYFEYAVEEGTDTDTYYSVTYELNNGYEDIRFIESNKLETPVHEDNVPPAPLLVQVTALFNPDEQEGKGTTSIFWKDVEGEAEEVYYIWRSGAPINNTSQSDVILVGTASEDSERFDYEVERGTIGISYYAVTTADALGNRDANVTAIARTGGINENTFDPWIAEPTNVQATYIGNGQTKITWTDQIGVEGEVYHVWFSEGVQLTGSSNVSRDATLVAAIPDGVQEAYAIVPINQDRMSYYCVTTEARYSQLNTTYEDFRFQQNCAAPVNEDTLPPGATLLSTPSLHVQGDEKFVLFQWLNNINEDGESFTLYRHTGYPWDDENATSGIISAENGWVVSVGPLLAPDNAEVTILKQVDLQPNTDALVWYALTVTDEWGNENTAATAPGNAYEVHEDTTAPTARVFVEGEDEDGDTITVQSLNEGEYELIFVIDEDLSEHPIINVTTSDIEYDPETGDVTVGHAFTDQRSTVRADPVSGKEKTYRLRMTVPEGLATTSLKVEYTLFDIVHNDATYMFENWTIDSFEPLITLYSPSSKSTYLYGEYVRIHGAVTDDIGISHVKLKFEKGLDDFPTTKTEWFNVTDLTTMDSDGKTMVFEWSDPAASWHVKGNQSVTIEATDLAGNSHTIEIIFIVDLCQRTTSGMTICATEVEDLKPTDSDDDGIQDSLDSCPLSPPGTETGADGCLKPGAFSGTYLLVYGVGAMNLLLLLIAIIAALLAGRDPAKRHRAGDEDEMTEEDDWMMEFMGGDSGDDVRSDLDTSKPDEKEEPEEEEEEEEEDDIFGENIGRQPTRRQKKRGGDDDSGSDSQSKVQRRSVKRRG